MKIVLKNLQKILKINSSSFRKLIEKICKFLNLKNSCISFVFVDNRFIRNLNKKYLGKDSPTDVLAFDLKDRFTLLHQKVTGVNPQRREKNISNLNFSGEIFISVEEAKRNSKIFSTDIHEELLLYVTHGLLHLIGFKDKTASQRMRMRKKEREILSYIFKEEEKIISTLLR
ncbi:MAG: rRNA maturation RNase YbeY [Candidatus Omnitrophica bacterium]|nr:rRNA maturation RNase YbeY [Candidatus Omnitrophota bacterium]